MTPVPPELASKHFFIEHLAQQLEAMEHGRTPVQPTAYRLYSRRLRTALAGYPPARLAHSLALHHPSVAEAMGERFFDMHGLFPGPHGVSSRNLARKLIAQFMPHLPR
jgi:hypothetical protein